MWRYVDYEGDDDQDIIVGVGDWADYGWDHAYDAQGRWRNGPLHGYVYLIENAGTDDEPDYSDKPTKIQAGGGEIDVYGWPSPKLCGLRWGWRFGYHLRRVSRWVHVL